MIRIALLTHGHFPAPDLLAESRPHVEICDVDIYDLPETDLAAFDALLIPTGVDQRVLAEQRERLQAFLDTGHAIVYCGHVAYPFLAGLAEFVPLEHFRLEDLTVTPVCSHPLFEGVEPHDLTFRKGVAGFYGRGHNPQPPDALVLNVLGTARVPLDWIRNYAGGGVLLVHAGNDVWGYGQDSSSASRLTSNLLQWIAGRISGDHLPSRATGSATSATKRPSV